MLSDVYCFRVRGQLCIAREYWHDAWGFVSSEGKHVSVVDLGSLVTSIESLVTIDHLLKF